MEKSYLELVEKILKEGSVRKTRNGNTYSIFGPQIEFNVEKIDDDTYVLPLLTTKKMFIRGIFEELIFFIRGETNSKILEEKSVNIWKGNTSREFLDSRGLYEYEEGTMGAMYGWNWRHFGAEYTNCRQDYTGQGYDQLKEVITSLSIDPNSRRHLMTTFDPSAVEKSVLAPCHGIAIQFYVDDGYLDCKMYQR